MQTTLTEYEALKNEQTSRLILRDAALHLNLVISLTAIGSLHATVVDPTIVWKIVTVVNMVMYWIYFTNDQFVNAIRAYVRTISTLPDANADDAASFGWEDFYRQRSKYGWMRSAVNALVQVVVFFAFGSYFLMAPLMSSLFQLDFESIQGTELVVSILWILMFAHFLHATFLAGD